MSGRAGAALAASAAGGIAYALGYVGFGAWPLLGAFLVPLWWALETVRERGVAVSLACGLVFGAVAHAAGFAWLWRLVDVFLAGDRAFGAALWLAHDLWFAAGFAAYAALHRALRTRGAGLSTAGIAPLVLVEWAQPQIFPVFAGAGLVAVPWLAQGAELGGPLLLTALVGAANVALFRLAFGPRRARALVAAVGVVAVVAAFGAQRVAHFGADAGAGGERVLRVGVVQANLGLAAKRSPGLATQRAHVALTRELLRDGPLDLVVWPETAIGRALRRPLPLDGQLVRDDLDVPLLFGATTVWEEGGRRVRANSALLVGADGAIRDAYDKNLLIPVAEWLPFDERLPALRERVPHAQRFRAARETPALALGDVRIATPICYEAIRPDLVRSMVRSSAPHLLVTLANDAWFGDSQEPRMHLALARLRAIEHRRWLVRATNSGISAVVDPAGRVRAHTGVLERATLRAPVGVRDGATLYARAGDWPALVALASVLLAFARARGRGDATRAAAPERESPPGDASTPAHR